MKLWGKFNKEDLFSFVLPLFLYGWIFLPILILWVTSAANIVIRCLVLLFLQVRDFFFEGVSPCLEFRLGLEPVLFWAIEILCVKMGYANKLDLIWGILDSWRSWKGVFIICWYLWKNSVGLTYSRVQHYRETTLLTATPKCKKRTHRWLISLNCAVITMDTDLLEIV